MFVIIIRVLRIPYQTTNGIIPIIKFSICDSQIILHIIFCVLLLIDRFALLKNIIHEMETTLSVDSIVLRTQFDEFMLHIKQAEWLLFVFCE